MMDIKREEELLLEAKDKEKAYNWLEATEIYEKIANVFLDENSLEKAAKYYKKLGHAYVKASHTADTLEGFKNISNLAINATHIFFNFIYSIY